VSYQVNWEIRVFYTIDGERRVIQIDHVARLP